MSAFECNLTPSRLRNQKQRNEDREPTFVDLRPFSGKSIVTFEDVPLSKTARRVAIISNPFDDELHVTLSKKPKAEFNIQLEWESAKIPAQSQVNLEIVWNPLKVVSCREIIQLTEDNGNKKDIAVILKSCELKKKTGRKIAPSGYPKKLKLKTPSPPSNFSRSVPQSKTLTSKFREHQGNQQLPAPVSPLRNTTNLKQVDCADSADIFDCLNFSSSKVQTNKENTPETPRNASALFNNIRFTPVTETLPKHDSRLDYLASLPTPTTDYRGIGVLRSKPARSNVMNFDLSPEVSTTNSRLTEVKSKDIPTIHNQAIPTIEFHLVTETQSKTFITTEEINEIEIVIEEHRSALGNTQILSSVPLGVIDEEAVATKSGFHKTFEVSNSLTSIVESKLPARVNSESMCEVYPKQRGEEVKKLKENQGSMPNLNEICGQVAPIESNRYFRQQQVEHCSQNLSLDSIVSNTEFRETEICAQSSRYNLLDFGSPSKTDPSESTHDSPIISTAFKNVQISENSEQMRQRLHSSPTMRRIQHDPDYKSPPKKSYHQMTFSPPARSRLSVDVRGIERRETFDIESRGRSIRATTWKQQQNQNSNQKVFAVPKVPRELGLRPLSMVSKSLTSLSTLSLASATSTSSTPSEMTKGRLYNENYVNAYNRKDPFSATTTNDPFLSSTMYLDEQTLDGIEKTYKKWLNALVTIPPDLESDKNEKIDVGKLFNDVQNKELTLAPTKEAVCSRYYTSRLDSLRMAAVQFFHSEAISTPLNKITVVINEKNKLDIKDERSIHLDLVLQRNLLELLLCYNPLWLRIGLEVIFNVQLNLHSNRDILGMSRFIVTSLFKSQYLAEKYSKFSQQKEYLDKLRKFTVKNFLFIIFFLDRAKEVRLIKQNPCLFSKKAPYKDSKDILKRFASLVLANYGDIIRMLGRWNFVVTHKQTVIDEFDFAFKNLAVDLRDGVRLTKVMEIILLRDDLVQKVRVPAISRLQKVHNVDLALKALESADYQILGNITSKDIADGHREKTLSLLWQIIYKFRAPRFNAAAKTIQKFWRSKYLMVVINRRIRQKKEEKLNRAATVIQKYFRGWQSRQATKKYKQKITKSCIDIQKNVRSFIVRRQFKRTIQSVHRIQRWFRSIKVTRTARAHFLLQRKSAFIVQRWWRRQMLATKLEASSVVIRNIKEEAFIRHKAAIVIQRSVKSFTVHKKLHAIIGGIVSFNRKCHRKNVAATKIQSYLKMKKDQQSFQLMKQSSIEIQRWWRHKLEGKQQLQKFTQLKKSTIVIQQTFRGILKMREERAAFLTHKNSIVRVQQRFRAILLMRQQRVEYQELRLATVILQQRFRALQAMKEQRTNYQLIRSVTVIIQRRFRANVLMKVQRKQFTVIKTSTIFIQRKLRATLHMKKEREEFLELKSAAICLQTRFRAQLIMKVDRHSFLIMKTATVHIQRRFRAQVAMRKQRTEYQTLRRAAIVIQQRFRANQVMKQERRRFLKVRQSAIQIQQRFRSTMQMRELTIRFYSVQYFASFVQQKFRAKLAMVKARNDFIALKTSTIFTQKRFRANKLAKETREKFVSMKKSAVIIQRKWRATIEMHKQREELQVIRKQTVFIQQRFRSNRAMRVEREKFGTLKTATVTIQRWFRSCQHTSIIRNQYLLMKKTVLYVEDRIISNRLMSIERKRYVELREAAVFIQQKFRGNLAAVKPRSEFLALKAATTIVQQRFRANKLMKMEQSEYLKLRLSAIHIQQRFRSTMLMRELKISFFNLKTSTIFIQQKFRAKMSMVRARDEFLALKAASIIVQRSFRANQLMMKMRSHFMKMRQCTIYIQQRFRSAKQMRELSANFHLLKCSAIIVQQKFRAKLAMVKARNQFLALKTSTISIQKRFRANKLAKETREKFVSTKKAAVIIQRKWRATIEMHKQREELQVIRKQTIFIQQRFRANRAMRVEREKFETLRTATVTIQRWFRSRQHTIIIRNQFLLMKKTVLLVEDRIIANRLMAVDRKRFVDLRQATMFAQRRFRSKIETRAAHQQFKSTRVMVIKLQSHLRGYLARQRFEAMKTPERMELRKKHKAARSIQAAWRGYKERANSHPTFRSIVDRLTKATRNVDQSQTLAAKLKMSMVFIREHYDSNYAISFLAKLEYMARTVPWILIDDAEFISIFCYGLMSQAIRSEVDKQIIELCSCIILNLSRYKDTKGNAFQEYGLMTIAQMLLRWCDKDCGIFNTLCTLVWVFAHCEHKKKIIRDFMTADGEFILAQIKQNVLRKENMRKNSRRPIGFQSISLVKYKKDYQMQLRYSSNIFKSGFITPEMLQQCKEIPSLQPDYGVVKTTPYIFYSSVFAFDKVVKILDIKRV